MVDPSGNDAILVVDYNSGTGLPIFGHALLYYESKGVWYKTEFNKKDGAFKVTNFEMSDMTKESIIKGFNDNIQYLCIAGNFENCYYYTKYCTDYYPKYHLIRNNCLHYVKKVLLFGTIYNSYLSKYLKKSLQYVPAVYITAAISINYVTKHTLQNMPSAPQIAKKNNNYLLRRIY